MTKEAQTLIDPNPVARGSYETDNIGAWKTFHVSSHASTKEDNNKIGVYTSAYAQQTDFNKTV